MTGRCTGPKQVLKVQASHALGRVGEQAKKFEYE